MLSHLVQTALNRIQNFISQTKSFPETSDQIEKKRDSSPVAPGAPSPLKRTSKDTPKKTKPASPVKKTEPPRVWQPSDFVVPEKEGEKRFHDLELPDVVMHGIYDLGYQYCTPIQAEILPRALSGTDVTGKAQTGTGKTAAFLISIYARLIGKPLKGKQPNGTPRVLIIAPTRELVLQIEKDARALGKYTRFRIQSILGGMQYDRQKNALLNKPVDVMIATPGRLLDFQRQKVLSLRNVEILVIDEADRMLDMGFIPDVRKIVYATPHKNQRQTMFWSATLKPEVERLAEQWTRDPVHVDIEPEQVAAESIRQRVYIATAEEKFALLVNLITGKNLDRVLVFVNRRDQTRRLAEKLTRYNILCAILSGEVPQNKRIKTLENFRNGKIRVLVATDVAARGIHVEGISHVINFTLPQDPEDYVHRIGRTGRAGASGISVSFADEDDSFYIPAIEEFLGTPLCCEQPDESLLKLAPPPPRKPPTKNSASAKNQAAPKNQSQNRNRRRRPSKSGRRPSGNRDVQKKTAKAKA